MSKRSFRALVNAHNKKDPLGKAKLDALCIAEELGYAPEEYVQQIVNATTESQITRALQTARERWVIISD